MAETSAPVYVSVVEALIYEEAQRAKQCLDESTEQWIVPVVEEEMIRSHLEAIVGKKDSGVVHMLKHQQTTDFNCMFKLLNRVSGGEKAMVSCLSAHLREEGKAFINSADELGPLIVVQVLTRFMLLNFVLKIILFYYFTESLGVEGSTRFVHFQLTFI